MITDFYAMIYEAFFSTNELTDFQVIFDHLYDFGGYVKMGIAFIFIPLILLSLFYFIWNYPYGKVWHWLVWIIIILLFTAGITFSIVNVELFSSSNQNLINALNNQQSGYQDFASTLPIKFALINVLLSLIVGFLLSLGMKLLSKIQMHLPF